MFGEKLTENGLLTGKKVPPAAEKHIANQRGIIFRLAAIGGTSFDDIVRVPIEDEQGRKI